ncbi:MAG TPA: PAS-domain containing protein [Pseudolabrys sp.]|nr:PAS-domain containing protein [Pseudolabrys sp.]
MHFPRKSLGLTARFAIFFGTELSAAASTARLADGIAEGKTFSNVVNLPDGRAFSVVNKPVAGGGWLATHEDVTETSAFGRTHRAHGAP